MNFNPELLEIIFLSLKVSGMALLIATLLGLPLAAWLGLKRFPGRGLIINLLNTFTGLWPGSSLVSVGSWPRSGPS